MSILLSIVYYIISKFLYYNFFKINLLLILLITLYLYIKTIRIDLYNENRLIKNNSYSFIDYISFSIISTPLLVNITKYSITISSFMNLIIIIAVAIKMSKKVLITNIFNWQRDFDHVNIYSISSIILFILNIFLLLRFTIGISLSNFICRFILNCVIVPITEEIQFRSILFNKFTSIYSKNCSIILTNVIFSLFHFTSIYSIIYSFILGCFMSLKYVKYNENLLPSIIIHSINNYFSLMLQSFF